MDEILATTGSDWFDASQHDEPRHQQRELLMVCWHGVLGLGQATVALALFAGLCAGCAHLIRGASESGEVTSFKVLRSQAVQHLQLCEKCRFADLTAEALVNAGVGAMHQPARIVRGESEVDDSTGSPLLRTFYPDPDGSGRRRHRETMSSGTQVTGGMAGEPWFHQP